MGYKLLIHASKELLGSPLWSFPAEGREEPQEERWPCCTAPGTAGAPPCVLGGQLSTEPPGSHLGVQRGGNMLTAKHNLLLGAWSTEDLGGEGAAAPEKAGQHWQPPREKRLGLSR